MITKLQASQLKPGDMLHFGTCTIHHGKRGGVKERHFTCKVNGKFRQYAGNPDRWMLPLKRGLYDYGYLTPENAGAFRLDCDCIPEEI